MIIKPDLLEKNVFRLLWTQFCKKNDGFELYTTVITKQQMIGLTKREREKKANER
jgi:hypothetical protein